MIDREALTAAGRRHAAAITGAETAAAALEAFDRFFADLVTIGLEADERTLCLLGFAGDELEETLAEQHRTWLTWRRSVLADMRRELEAPIVHG